MLNTGTFLFDGPAGRIEALYRPPSAGGNAQGEEVRSAIVCHPLTTEGGTMHNKVVFRAGKAFEKLGWAVLRFNFRGAGRSEGAFDDGAGEADDTRAALDWLATEHPGAPITLAGFSFGCAVGLPVGAEDDRVVGLVGMGTPTRRFPFTALGESSKPKLFVQGSQDEHGPLGPLREGLEKVAEPWKLVVVEDADHFFTGRLPALQHAITDYFISRQ